MTKLKLCLSFTHLIKRYLNKSTKDFNKENYKKLKFDSLQKLARLQSNVNSFPLYKTADLPSSDVIAVEGKFFPSVSGVLNATMSPQSLAALEKWKAKKIEQLGEDGFKLYQQNLLGRGKLLHQNIKMSLDGVDQSNLMITKEIEKLWHSLRLVLSFVDDVKMCETYVHHPHLYYRGIVDCVASYKNKLVLLEWKTSEKLKSKLDDLYDNPIQSVAYLGAINFDPNFMLNINEVVLVYSYEDGSDAQVHCLDASLCQQYWLKWLERLKLYWKIVLTQSQSKQNN